MGLLLAFAFVSGIITILSPCILPVLPIVLAGSVSSGKSRPFGVVAGFVISFTIFTLLLTTLVQLLGISADALRFAAVVIIILLGLILIVPKLHEGFLNLASRLVNFSRKNSGQEGGKAGKKINGFTGGLAVGFSLGLVWTPCAGPIMASVVSLALTERLDSGAVLITLAYSLGTALPMLAVMLGSRALLNRVPILVRNAERIQKVFGVLMIVIGISIGLGWDRRLQAAILGLFPGYGTGLTAIENIAPVQEALERRRNLPVMDTQQSGEFKQTTPPGDGKPHLYGTAPEIAANGPWYNTEGNLPLTMEKLKGKVVLVDFWTYSCINCLRTIPYLKAWHTAYKDKGLVIIGVHTPEFEFEKIPANVQKELTDLGITWPVVLDNDYKQWRAYDNRYWPAHYFIDAQGQVRYFHFGEGQYREAEKVIQALLKEAGKNAAAARLPAPYSLEAVTPETYLGYGRARGFASAVVPAAGEFTEYTSLRQPAAGEWNLTGEWMITEEYIVPRNNGTLQLGFNARQVFLVVEPEAGEGAIRVQVDGKPGSDTPDVKNGMVIPAAGRLYHLVALERPGEHVLQLDVTGRLRLFAFTFG